MWEKHKVSIAMIISAILFLFGYFFGDANFNLSVGIIWGVAAVVEFIIESKKKDQEK